MRALEVSGAAGALKDFRGATGMAELPDRAGADTGVKILRAAADVFATHGYEGASIRTIAERAGVGLSAVHYHYGSKAALYDAVCRFWTDHTRPLQRAALASAGAGPRAAVLDALIRPVLQQACEPGMLVFSLATGRSFLEPADVPRAAFDRLERPIVAAFVDALGGRNGSPPPPLVERALLNLSVVARHCLFDPTYASATGKSPLPSTIGPLVDTLVAWGDGFMSAIAPDALLDSPGARSDGTAAAPTDAPDTTARGAILDAARASFARSGYLGASMRDILRRSGANASSAYHFFGDKEGMYRAVVEEGLVPLCAARDRNMDALDLSGRGRADAVAALIRAWVEPHLMLWVDRPHADYMRLIARFNYEPNRLVSDLHARHIRAVRARYIAALRAVLPEIGEDLAARLMALAIAHMCFAPFDLTNLARPAFRFGADVAARLVERVVAEAAAGVINAARVVCEKGGAGRGPGLPVKRSFD